MSKEDKVKTSLRVFDPEGVYHAKVLKLAKHHFKNNPDKLDSVRDANVRSGITWMLRYLIDKEYSAMMDFDFLKQTIQHPPTQ